MSDEPEVIDGEEDPITEPEGEGEGDPEPETEPEPPVDPEEGEEMPEVPVVEEVDFPKEVIDRNCEIKTRRQVGGYHEDLMPWPEQEGSEEEEEGTEEE